MKKNISSILSSVFSKNNFTLRGISSNLFIVGFLLILISSGFSELFTIESESSLNEKRTLEQKPKFKIKKTYPQEFEKYYNDNFGLRSLLVNWNSKIKIDYFKVSSDPESVLFGADGYLFHNSKSDSIYQSYSNQKLITEADLERIYKKQLGFKNTFAKSGIKYIVGFFPNKHSIYPEKLPFSMKLQIQKDTSFASKIVSYFDERNFQIIDVREDLLNGKDQGQLYLKFDTHWNALGAHVAYQAFFEQTFNEFNISPYDDTYFEIEYEEKRNGDLTSMIGVKKMTSYYDNKPIFKLKNKDLGFEKIATDGFPNATTITLNEKCGNTDTVIVFRDSYTSEMVQFLSLHFYKVVYIWDSKIDMDLVDKCEADIVMSLTVERYLGHFLR